MSVTEQTALTSPIATGDLMSHLPPAVSGETANSLALIQHGIANNMPPEALERLLAMHERIMAKEAEKQFADAMKAFQADCSIVGKNKTAKIKTKAGGEYSYGFADLAHVAETIKPYCERHGFSYGFKQCSDGNKITITCIVRHVGGHREETTFSGLSDTEASMSAMQKSGAATTFARRYALALAFGLSIGDDTDARPLYENPDEKPDAPKIEPRNERQPPPKPPVTADMLRILCTEWKTAMDVPDFKKAESHFVEWMAKHLTAGGPSNWKDAATWTKDQYDACMGALGL